MKKFALIPAFEPDERLLALCFELTNSGFQIVIVDDGSDMDYEEIFNQAAQTATCLCHIDHLGRGAAIKTGLRHIHEIANGDDVVVTVDADGKHRLADVERLARAAAENTDCLVLGSRSLEDTASCWSRIGGKIARTIYHAAAHCEIEDWHTGLRAFSCALIPFFLKIAGDRREYERNVLLRCAKMGISMEELPIESEAVRLGADFMMDGEGGLRSDPSASQRLDNRI